MSEFIYPDLTNSTFDSPYGRLMALPGDLRPAVGVIHGHSTSTEDPDPPPVTGQRFAVVDEDDLAAQERLFDLTGAYNFAIVNGANPLFQIIGSSGQLVFGQYGEGFFEDTPIWALGVDGLGNLIEYDPTMGGSGVDLMRFAYPGEDDTAAEDRLFSIGDSFQFRLYATDTIKNTYFNQDVNNISIGADLEDFSHRNYFIASEGNLQAYQQDNVGGTEGRRIILDRADGITIGELDSGIYKGIVVEKAGAGKLQFNAYGLGDFVDTPVYGLGVLADGTIVEYDPTTGGGSGVDLFRFAVATEDDLAGETRAFEQAGFSFSIFDGGGTDATLQLDPASGSYQLGKNIVNGAYFSANATSNVFTAQAGNASYIAMDAVNSIFHVVMAGGFDHLNLDAGTGVYEIGDISSFGVGNNNFIRINDAAQTAFFRVANFAGATVGDVLTLLSTTTGEAEWQPAGGGGGGSTMRFGYAGEDDAAGENRTFDMTADPTYRLTLNAANTFAEGPAFVVNSLGSIGTAIYGTTTDGRGLWGSESGGGVAVMGISDGAGGYALYGAASLGNALYALSQAGIAGEFHIQVPSLDTVAPIIVLSRELPGPDQPLVGIGGSIDYYTSTDAGGTSIISELTNQLISILIDVTNGTRTSEFSLTGVGNAIMNVLMTFSGLGLLSFPQGMSDYADDAAAAAGTPVIPVNGVYRNGSQLMIRVA